MRLRRVLTGAFWILLYLLLVLAPIGFMMLEPRPQGREFWREFSVALGFVGLAMMTLQFALTARIKFVNRPYGSDIVYYFHRQISTLSFMLILAHPLILFIADMHPLSLLNIFAADTPWRARFATVSILALTGLVVTSVWRKKLRIEYTRWRIWHGLLATAAVALAMAHAVGVGIYINTPAKRILWAGYAIFFVGLLFYTRVLKPFYLLRRPWKVLEVVPERASTWTVWLAPDGHRGFSFLPGQFAWLTAWESPFKDTEHPFSISSSAEQKDRLALTIKSLGDFSASIKNLQPGQRVYLDGPYGAFSCDRHPHAEGYVFIAGGVGITPMMSMLSTLADRGDRRKHTLIYANRDWDSIIMRDQIDALTKKMNLKVVHVLEVPPEGWQGETGFITREILDRHLPPMRVKNSFEIFICGPAPMMDAVENALVTAGIYVGDLHSERFDLV